MVRNMVLGKVQTWALALGVGIVGLLGVEPLRAERPSGPKLLPDSTLAYIRINDSREMAEKFRETSMGRLTQDEKILPLIKDLYGSASDAFQQIQEEIGVSLDDLLTLPQGEVCFAIVDVQTTRPAAVFLMDLGENQATVEKLLERAIQEVQNSEGASHSEQVFGETTYHCLRQPPGDNDPSAFYFLREATFVMSTDEEVLRDLIASWDGVSETRKLADNRKFTGIMTRSAGTKEERPQMTWYADPLEFAKAVTRDNFGAQTVIALLPSLGLDGFKAVGGSLIMATEEFDSIAHMHILMDNPRRGVLQVLALDTGDSTPEVWVPNDVATYTTLFFDFNKAYGEVEKQVSRFRGEGMLRSMMERRISDPLGIDFQADVLDQLDGRVSLATWFQKPIKVNSQTTIVGVRLKEPERFKKTLQELEGRFGDVMERKSYRQTTYYRLSEMGDRRGRDNLDETILRRPEPSVAVVGDYLLFTDSEECLKHVLSTKANPSQSLANELDYKLVASRIRSHLGTSEPSLVAFERPEESMQSLYEMAVSPDIRQRLGSAAEQNPFFGAVNQALEDNPLPPFAEIAKYLAPSGAMMVSDDTGIHYMAFGLKRE